MKRRHLLVSLVPLVAGCGGGSNEGGTSPAASETASPSATSVAPSPTTADTAEGTAATDEVTEEATPPAETTTTSPPTTTSAFKEFDTEVPGRLRRNDVEGLRVNVQFATKSDDLFQIRARLRNTTDRPIRDVIGRVALFDGQTQFDDTVASVSEVLAGETKNLDVLYNREPDRVTFYELIVEPND